jgi:prevent-host-death family protein
MRNAASGASGCLSRLLASGLADMVESMVSRNPRGRTIMTTVSATEFSARALELLKSVESGDTVVVHRNGTPIARMVPNCPASQIEQSSDEMDDAPTSDVFSGGFLPMPLTEFRFGTSTMKLHPHEPEVNLNWFHVEDDDDA